MNDIIWSIDDGTVVPLVLLDLSAVFDTVDHGIHLEVPHTVDHGILLDVPHTVDHAIHLEVSHTVDHGILLKVRHNRFSVTDISLSWFRSYLTDRTQSISVNGVQSERSAIYCSVPQGSVLRSIEFISYTEDVVVVFHSNLVHHQLFADDKQLYSATSIANIDETRKRLVSCILDVRDWCTSRRLQLNILDVRVWCTSRRLQLTLARLN